MKLKTGAQISQINLALVLLLAFFAFYVGFSHLSSVLGVYDNVRMTQAKTKAATDFHRHILLAPGIEQISKGKNLIWEAKNQVLQVQSYFDDDDSSPYDFNRISDRLNILDENFQKLTQLQMEIGFTRNDGLRGEFRRAAHQLQALSQSAHDRDIEVSILELRRREKDFLLRREATYLSIHQTLITQIQTQINQSTTLKKSQKEQAKDLVYVYQNKFQKLVDVMKKLGLTNDDGVIAKLLEEDTLLISEINDMSQVITDYLLADAKQFLFKIVGLIVLGLVFTAGLIHWSFIRTFRGLMEISDKIHEIVKSEDYSIRIKKDYDNEFDLLSHDLNSLVTHFETTLENLNTTRDKLIETERMAFVGRLVSGVAHEMNTPLGIIVTSESFLKESINKIHHDLEQGTLQKSTLQEKLNDAQTSLSLIESNLERTSALISSFKQVSVQNTYNEIVEFQLEDMIKAVQISLNRELEKFEILLTFDVPQNTVIKSYYSAFTQLLNIMIVNAIRHALEEGQQLKIHCEITISSVAILIKVTDNGNGISESVRPHIFEPFYTTKRNKGGTGLGLSVLFNIVNQTFNGSVDVLNLSPGCQFLCTLPLSEQVTIIPNTKN